MEIMISGRGRSLALETMDRETVEDVGYVKCGRAAAVIRQGGKDRLGHPWRCWGVMLGPIAVLMTWTGYNAAWREEADRRLPAN